MLKIEVSFMVLLTKIKGQIVKGFAKDEREEIL